MATTEAIENPVEKSNPQNNSNNNNNNNNTKRSKTASILSFDGGGSKGVMELVVVDAIFRLATLLIETPKQMPR